MQRFCWIKNGHATVIVGTSFFRFDTPFHKQSEAGDFTSFIYLVLLEIVWCGFATPQARSQLLPVALCQESGAIDSLMPKKTHVWLGLQRGVFPGKTPADEMRGSGTHPPTAALFPSPIHAKFLSLGKLRKALCQRAFNSYTLRIHPHDFKKTHLFKIEVAFRPLRGGMNSSRGKTPSAVGASTTGAREWAGVHGLCAAS